MKLRYLLNVERELPEILCANYNIYFIGKIPRKKQKQSYKYLKIEQFCVLLFNFYWAMFVYEKKKQQDNNNL